MLVAKSVRIGSGREEASFLPKVKSKWTGFITVATVDVNNNT